MKICSICKICKPYENFHKHPKTKDKHASQCKECDKKEKCRRQRERKQKLIDLAGGACQKCGYNKCIDALDFHHYKGKKEFLVSRRTSFYKLKLEAQKCMVICANCHREEHWMQFQAKSIIPLSSNGRTAVSEAVNIRSSRIEGTIRE